MDKATLEHKPDCECERHSNIPDYALTTIRRAAGKLKKCQQQHSIATDDLLILILKALDDNVSS